MLSTRTALKLARPANTHLRKCLSTLNRGSLPEIDRVHASYVNLNIDDFRNRAFKPQRPLLISERDEAGNITGRGDSIKKGLPASYKWFSPPCNDSGTGSIVSREYLSSFGHTSIPYELFINSDEDTFEEWYKDQSGSAEAGSISLLQLRELLQNEPKNPHGTFHHFEASLEFFLQACQSASKPLKGLYIAQAQIMDLPKELQDDLPTPQLVKEAGKGDVYDANIWLGIPPTYTPLHKDPNPNLFLQLANTKRVRIFPPQAGSSLFRRVQQSIGSSFSASIRGDEMMQGLEREALDQAVWGLEASGGFEAVVRPGDAVFIPKGWWHSFKSIGDGVNGSVNWWFR